MQATVADLDHLEDLVSTDFAAAGARASQLMRLVGLDPAVRRCEDLRRAVRRHCWDEVRRGLAVSVSIGVTTTRPGDDQRSVLGRADANLYGAKAGGRDRVVGDALSHERRTA